MDIEALSLSDYEVWVRFMDAEVLLRHVALHELMDIRTHATRRTWDGSGAVSEQLDANEANRLLGRAALRGWRGITMKGQDYPFTADNAELLMTRWLEFSRFVSDMSANLTALVQAQAESVEKKLSNTSEPGSTIQK